jgi:GNAT superfamily N-acetyltransferase
MPIAVHQVSAAELPRYDAIPSAFTVDAQYRVEEADGGLGGLRLVWEPVSPPWVKDYDAAGLALPEPETPATWPRLFDVRNWAFWLAECGDVAVGAAAVAFDTPGIHLLDRRRDIAVLWDIRVHPEWQRGGVGRALVRAAADWARSKRCRQLKIETQNINVRACRFYAAQSCHLGAIHRRAYAGYPNEAMLLWYLDL